MTDDLTPSGGAEAEPHGAPQPVLPDDATAAFSSDMDDAGTADMTGRNVSATGQDDNLADPSAARRRPKRSAQQRIDEITGKFREAERQKQAAEEESRRLLERLEAYETPAPDARDYDSEHDFRDALTDHEVRQAGRQHEVAGIAEARARSMLAEQDAHEALQQDFTERAAAFAAQVPDFSARVTDPSLPISEAMGVQIMASELGPEIAYYLASDPAQAAQISKLNSPQEVAREIGRIEGRLTRTPPKNVTQAPDPVRAIVTGSGSQSSFDAHRASIDEMEARLKKAGVIS